MSKEKIWKICKIVQRITLLLGVLTIILPMVFWKYIPDEIPAHYGGTGQVDRFSDKSGIILLLFVVALVMGMMSIAAYFVKTNALSKYATESEKSEMEYVYPMIICINFVVQVMFSYIIFCSATSRNLGVAFLPITLFATFAPVGYFLFQSRKNASPSLNRLGCLKQTEKEEKGVVYKSKVDWWLGLIMIGAVLLELWVCVRELMRTRHMTWSLFFMLLVIFVIGSLLNIRYVFYSEHLKVLCGCFGNERIPYRAITNVKETHNPLSSAALSLQRIQIDYVIEGKHQMVLISPVRKKEFLEKLEGYRKVES